MSSAEQLDEDNNNISSKSSSFSMSMNTSELEEPVGKEEEQEERGLVGEMIIVRARPSMMRTRARKKMACPTSIISA